jgi:NOL1/NOP2/fmu family ribosome biogenesis protein
VSKLAFEPHKFNKDQFKAIGEHIIVADMEFKERISYGGIYIPNDDMKSEGIRPRWAKVYALGPDFKDDEIKLGSWICISHGRWTRGVDIEDETGKHTLRRVDPNDILLVSDEPVNDFTLGDKGL